jgi:lysyl-tRNA synthetase class 2
MSAAPQGGDAGGDAPAAGAGEAGVAADRRAKRDALRARGVEPYPVGVAVRDGLGETHRRYADALESGQDSRDFVRVAGRLVRQRGHGRLVFLVLAEGDDELQVMCRQDRLGQAGMEAAGELDVGDWVAAGGTVARSKRGELSVDADEVELIGKSLRPLPDKWHGLRDVETRYRHREVDLAVNPQARRVLQHRARVLHALRGELAARDYLEVETPVLHPIPGGANATPFVTRHEALDTDLYLRVAPELYLKRLVAGGLPRVYEIGRVFRNEGLSPRHNPEFTMLESYQAYADYHDMMDLTEQLIQAAATAATGELTATVGQREVDLSAPWPRRRLLELVAEATGAEGLSLAEPRARFQALCDTHHVAVEPAWGPGKLAVALYEKLVEPHLVEPTFVLDYPVEVSPLARRHRDDPALTERFELLIGGREMANAFSELTDPVDQRQRFEAQAAAKAAGDTEAMAVDEAYLAAMELGMPPMGGLGIGLDRLVMLLAGVESIRDAIAFPTLRPG